MLPPTPRPLGAAVGIVLDRLLGEPPAPVHPVVLFGRAMEITERMIYRDTWLAGAAHAAVGAALGVGAGALAPSTALATVLAVGGRGLARAALEVSGALAASDEVRARELLPALVGRDPTGLDAGRDRPGHGRVSGGEHGGRRRGACSVGGIGRRPGRARVPGH